MFIKCAIVIVIVLGQIDTINSNKYSAFFKFSQLQWEDARTKCRLVGDGANVPLKDINVTLHNYTSDIGWIDAKAAYQPWMEYVGCFVINLVKIRRVVTVRRGHQLLDCILQCTGYFYVGLQQSKCVCVSNVTLVNPDVTSTCYSYFCNHDGNSLCAADHRSRTQFALYRKGTRSVTRNIGDCLAITVNRRLRRQLFYKPAPCETSLYPVCYKRGIPIRTRWRRTWNEAVTACSRSSAVLASPYHIRHLSSSTPDGSYWLAQIRKVQLNFTKDFVPGVENYCVAARVMPNGYLQTFIKSCKDHLSSLCHADVITTDQTTDTTPPYAITTEQITDTTPPYAITTEQITDTIPPNVTTTDKTARGRTQSTPSSRRNRSLPSALSDGVLAVVVFFPGVFVVGIVALIGWFLCRYYAIKATNTGHVTGMSYSTSPSTNSSGTTEGYYDAVSKEFAEKEMKYYYSSINQQSDNFSYYDDSSTYQRSSYSNTYYGKYNRIKHSSEIKATGYDVPEPRENHVVADDYDVVQRTPFIRHDNDYDTTASISLDQSVDQYDKADNVDVDTFLEHYDTVTNILEK